MKNFSKVLGKAMVFLAFLIVIFKGFYRMLYTTECSYIENFVMFLLKCQAKMSTTSFWLKLAIIVGLLAVSCLIVCIFSHERVRKLTMRISKYAVVIACVVEFALEGHLGIHVNWTVVFAICAVAFGLAFLYERQKNRKIRSKEN